jgi:NAD(P)-dependent dehydrogenase (short-subunit alcohol dehydrogenase family)
VDVAVLALDEAEPADLAGALRLSCDIRDDGAVIAAVQAVLERFGRLDMLVNNAALVGRQVEAPILEHSTELFQKVIETNLVGQFIVLREAARAMVARGAQGRIVNVSSVRGHLGGERTSAYNAAKAGVIGLTQSAALELAPHGIRVNSVAPGFIATESALREAETAEPWRFDKQIPLGRPGTPDEAARVIAALLSPDSGFVTGSTWDADGGIRTF